MHEVYALFHKRANCYDRMELTWMGVLLGGKNLTWRAFLDHFNAIFQNRGPKVSCAQSFMGSSQPREMNTTSSSMEIIQDDFIFLMCETTL